MQIFCKYKYFIKLKLICSMNFYVALKINYDKLHKNYSLDLYDQHIASQSTLNIVLDS